MHCTQNSYFWTLEFCMLLLLRHLVSTQCGVAPCLHVSPHFNLYIVHCTLRVAHCTLRITQCLKYILSTVSLQQMSFNFNTLYLCDKLVLTVAHFSC